MPVNGQDVKFNYYTRAKFNALSSKDNNAIYYVEETDNTVSMYLGNRKISADGDIALDKLNVTDVRDLAGGSSTFNLTPNEVEDKTIKPYFAQLSGAGSSWRSLINVKGWTGTYANWQLIGPGGTSADDDLYFRSGAGASWRTPRKIFHSGNLTAGDIPSHTHSQYLLTTGKASDSDKLNGLELNSTTTNNQANKVMRTDGSGYANFGWIKTTSGNTTDPVTDVYVNTTGGWIYKKSLPLFKAELGTMPPSTHTHDDRYYTETEVNTLLSAKANVSGLNSHINNKNNPHGVTGAQLGLPDYLASSGSTIMMTNKSSIEAGTSGNTLIGGGLTSTGLNNVAVGAYAKVGDWGVAIGRQTEATGGSSVALGRIAISTGTYSTALGTSATATVNYATALGSRSNAIGLWSTAIGDSAVTGASNRLMRLGDVNLSTLQSNVNLSVTSDIRDKADIEEVPKALDFIKDLNPITYVRNDRDNYISDEQKETETYKDYLMVEDYDKTSYSQGTKKGKRRRIGLSAQEVRNKLIEHYGSDNYANVVNDNFVEFEERGLDVPECLENKLTMSYETMVPFLIKAIQEQQEQIEELKKKIKVEEF